jgi:hypothetical protein
VCVRACVREVCACARACVRARGVRVCAHRASGVSEGCVRGEMCVCVREGGVGGGDFMHVPNAQGWRRYIEAASGTRDHEPLRERRERREQEAREARARERERERERRARERERERERERV